MAKDAVGINDAVEKYLAGQRAMAIAEEYCDGEDPIGKTHVREGIVVRIVNRPKFTAYKHKNFSFKCLAGIAVADADTDSLDDDILSEM